MAFSMAAALGSLVMVLSNVGVITRFVARATAPDANKLAAANSTAGFAQQSPLAQ